MDKSSAMYTAMADHQIDLLVLLLQGNIPTGASMEVAQPPAEAWSKLCLTLNLAIEAKRSGKLNADGLNDEFAVVEQVVHAVYIYLQSSNDLQKTRAAEPFLSLIAAFDEMAGGVVAPLLNIPREKKKEGTPSIDHFSAFNQGTAARAMDELVKAGRPAAEASQMVVEAIKLGNPTKWRGLKATTIKNWRDKCRQRKAPKRVMEHFNYNPIELIGKSSLEIAELLLKVLGRDQLAPSK